MFNNLRRFSQTPYPRLQMEIFTAVKQVRIEQDRSPTVQELSLQIGAPIERILEAMEYNLNENHQSSPKHFSVH